VSRINPASRRVTATIRDHGRGVTDDDLGRLFSRFGRGGQSDDSEGTGLGLYVSRELCRAMDGDLRYESVAGPGAAFTIDLPGEPPEA
jgi:signal transduction histidine kinase